MLVSAPWRHMCLQIFCIQDSAYAVQIPARPLERTTSSRKGSFRIGIETSGDCTTASAGEVGSPQRDQVSWTGLISRHVRCGQDRQALTIYDQMQEGGVEPNSYTVVAALKACSRLRDLRGVRRIHAQVVETGLQSDVHVGTMLVDVYAKCRSLVDAKHVFQQMPCRNVVAWNAIILGHAQMGESDAALQLYAQMQQEGLVPSDRTFVGTLKACSSLAALEQGNDVEGECVKKESLKQLRAIHSDVVKTGSESNLFVGNMLVDVYAKCGSIVDARHVFDTMPRRNVVSWTTMISAYSEMGEGEVALRLYAKMQQEGVVPDERAFVGALKACSSLVASEADDTGDLKQRCLDQVRAIHSDIAMGQLESHVFVGTMLVDVYSKCASLVEARHVFDKMPIRDVVAWNAMISGYAQMDDGREALQLYTRMQRENFVPNERTFIGALKACSCLTTSRDDGDGNCTKEQCLEQARAIHSDIVTVGSDSDLFVGNMLVDVYSRCGSLVDARYVFDRMPHRDVVAWNAMILGYAEMKDGEVALLLYAQMQRDGVLPNERTFVGALKACSSLKELEEGNPSAEGKCVRSHCLQQVRGIHADVVNMGYASNVVVGNMLLDVYAKCGSLVEARHVFDNITGRNVVSWTSIIFAYAQSNEGGVALALYRQMQHDGVPLDSRAFVGALKACISLAALEEASGGDGLRVKKQCLDQVRGIHSDMAEGHFESDVFVDTMLVDAYGQCGSLVDARNVFQKMPHRDLVSWNTMIQRCTQMEQGDKVMQLYTRMQQEGLVPNDQAFVCALKACSSLAAVSEGNLVKNGCLDQVRAIHADVLRGQFQSDVYVETMLVDAYAKCGSMVDARHVFEIMSCRDVVVWNAMILGYAQVDAGEMALELYTQMKHDGLVPNERTFLGALKACCCLPKPEEGNLAGRKPGNIQSLGRVRAIHSDIVQTGCETDVFVANMLVDVYAKCGNLVDARQIFEGMAHRDVVSWTAMILGHAQMEEGEEALQLYVLMQQEGVLPNERTFIAGLKACGCVAALDKGKEIHAQILKFGLQTIGLFVPNALIDMYSKCGSMGDAQQVFDALSKRDIVTWTTLIAGYARQGQSELVFDLFARMRQEGIQPNAVTFLSVLTVCSHVGLVEKGQKYFQAMTTDYAINPTMEHYICMIDLLGRVGQLDKAMEMVELMPYIPDCAVWKTVLAACQKWSNVELGRRAFECAVKADEKDSAAYVLMSNIYAAVNMWEEAKEVQARRVETQAQKQPGESWVADVGGSVHTFVVGGSCTF